MKRIFTIAILAVATFMTNAQVVLDRETIEDIVRNEKSYFDDIVQVFNNDDPYLDIDDVALVYYGQAFLPSYKPGRDENEKLMKKYYNEDNYHTAEEIAELMAEGEAEG